jgi:hypothetical protein
VGGPDQSSAVTEFQRLNLCLQAAKARRFFTANSAWREQLLGPSPPNLPEEQRKLRESQLETMNLMVAKIDRAKSECIGVSDEDLTDNAIYDAALRAAIAGDQSAANCYVGTAYEMSADLQRSKSAFDTYKANAPKLISTGIAKGDWVAVALGREAYSSNYSDKWLKRAIPPDPAAEYRMAKLQELGAPDANAREQLRPGLQDLIERLDPAVVTAADRWARKTYTSAFASRAPFNNSDVICQ